MEICLSVIFLFQFYAEYFGWKNLNFKWPIERVLDAFGWAVEDEHEQSRVQTVFHPIVLRR